MGKRPHLYIVDLLLPCCQRIPAGSVAGSTKKMFGFVHGIPPSHQAEIRNFYEWSVRNQGKPGDVTIDGLDGLEPLKTNTEAENFQLQWGNSFRSQNKFRKMRIRHTVAAKNYRYHEMITMISGRPLALRSPSFKGSLIVLKGWIQPSVSLHQAGALNALYLLEICKVSWQPSVIRVAGVSYTLVPRWESLPWISLGYWSPQHSTTMIYDLHNVTQPLSGTAPQSVNPVRLKRRIHRREPQVPWSTQDNPQGLVRRFCTDCRLDEMLPLW